MTIDINIRNIPIALPSIGTEELEAVKEPILSGWLTQGPQVKSLNLSSLKSTCFRIL